MQEKTRDTMQDMHEILHKRLQIVSLRKQVIITIFGQYHYSAKYFIYEEDWVHELTE